MIDSPATPLDRSLDDLVGILRRLATAVRGINNFERFLGSLEGFFERVAAASGRSIRFEALPAAGEAAAVPFAEPELTAPVAVEHSLSGLVRVAPPAPERPFGPGDLRLVGTLAELTAALLGVSRRVRDSGGAAQTLRLVYDQLPIGVVCFTAEGGPVLVNARAQMMLEGSLWANRDAALAFLDAHASEASRSDAAASCFAAASGTVLADVREVIVEGGGPVTIIVLVALDSHERNLRIGLEREIYRSRWLGQPLALVVLETAGDPGQFFARLADVRLSLRSGDCCEVLGERQMGLVLPGRPRVQALQMARQVARTLGAASLRSSCLLLEHGHDRADAMIEEARAALAPADALLQPRVLVVDRYRAVPDTVELIVRRTFAVEKAAGPDEGLQRLRDTPVDAVFVEHEPDEGFSGFEFLHAARLLQPDVAGVLTTTRLDLPHELSAVPENARFLRKPFSLDSLRQTLAALTPAINSPS